MNTASTNNGMETGIVEPLRNKDGTLLPLSSDYKKPRTPWEVVEKYKKLAKRIKIPRN